MNDNLYKDAKQFEKMSNSFFKKSTVCNTAIYNDKNIPEIVKKYCHHSDVKNIERFFIWLENRTSRNKINEFLNKWGILHLSIFLRDIPLLKLILKYEPYLNKQIFDESYDEDDQIVKNHQTNRYTYTIWEYGLWKDEFTHTTSNPYFGATPMHFASFLKEDTDHAKNNKYEIISLLNDVLDEKNQTSEHKKNANGKDLDVIYSLLKKRKRNRKRNRNTEFDFKQPFLKKRKISNVKTIDDERYNSFISVLKKREFLWSSDLNNAWDIIANKSMNQDGTFLFLFIKWLIYQKKISLTPDIDQINELFIEFHKNELAIKESSGLNKYWSFMNSKIKIPNNVNMKMKKLETENNEKYLLFLKYYAYISSRENIETLEQFNKLMIQFIQKYYAQLRISSKEGKEVHKNQQKKSLLSLKSINVYDDEILGINIPTVTTKRIGVYPVLFLREKTRTYKDENYWRLKKSMEQYTELKTLLSIFKRIRGGYDYFFFLMWVSKKGLFEIQSVSQFKILMSGFHDSEFSKTRMKNETELKNEFEDKIKDVIIPNFKINENQEEQIENNIRRSSHIPNMMEDLEGKKIENNIKEPPSSIIIEDIDLPKRKRKRKRKKKSKKKKEESEPMKRRTRRTIKRKSIRKKK